MAVENKGSRQNERKRKKNRFEPENSFNIESTKLRHRFDECFKEQKSGGKKQLYW